MHASRLPVGTLLSFNPLHSYPWLSHTKLHAAHGTTDSRFNSVFLVSPWGCMTTRLIPGELERGISSQSRVEACFLLSPNVRWHTMGTQRFLGGCSGPTRSNARKCITWRLRTTREVPQKEPIRWLVRYRHSVPKHWTATKRFTHPCGCCSCVCWGLSPSLALSHCSHRGRWTCLCASLVRAQRARECSKNLRGLFASSREPVQPSRSTQSRNVYRLRRIFLGRLVVVFACVSLSLSDGTLACLARRLCTHK